MVVWEIEARRGLANSVPDDSGTVHFPKNHTDVGTAHIPARRFSTRTVHICADMTIVVQMPWRNGSPIMLPWTQ